MKSQFLVAAVAATFLGVTGFSSRAHATTIGAAINGILQAESGIGSPTVEIGIGYRSAKIEYGMVENDESVFDYEVEIGWLGFFCGFEACHDMTDVNRRRGRYNEIESSLGYGLKLGDFSARGAYVHKSVFAGDEPDTQEVEVELDCETPWVTPVLELVCDTCEKPGAIYGVAGIVREWELCERLTLIAHGGVGFGNAYHNGWCFGRDRWAFREMHLGATLEIRLCPHVKLVPGIDFYDYFTEAQRKTYDRHNGFIAVAGCRLEVDF